MIFTHLYINKVNSATKYPKIAFVAEFNLFLNGKFKFQATFGQIADADGASMQEDGILHDGET